MLLEYKTASPKKTKRERNLVDFVPAHFAVTVVTGQRQVTVIAAVPLRLPFRVVALDPGSCRLTVSGSSFPNRCFSRRHQRTSGSVKPCPESCCLN